MNLINLLSALGIFMLATATQARAQQFHFTTLAGPAGGLGSSDGSGSTAQFRNPNGVAVDGAGNVYVADTDNQTIRKITPEGVVTTLAGLAQDLDAEGHPGPVPVGDYADGTGNAARFNSPSAVAVDSAGNVYVADTGNHVIRRISPGAVVTTLAGLALTPGSADGIGSAARLNAPNGIAVDRSGNVYVTDRGNRSVRKISPDGMVSTLPGLFGACTQFSVPSCDGPLGVAVDSAGNVYVTEGGTIRKITPWGVISTLAGATNSFGSVDGSGSDARFRYPNNLAVDRTGNLYVADTDNNTIRMITPDGKVSTLAGLAGMDGSEDGKSSDARFSYPLGVAVDSAGNVYVADTYNQTIRKITPGALVSTVAGFALKLEGSGFPAAGMARGSADGAGGAARFYEPNGLAVDHAGVVYIADTGNQTIRKITRDGIVSTLAGLAQDTNGDGFPDGASADGMGSSARFDEPHGVGVDGAGNVYVADTGNQTIRKITPNALVSTFAGFAGSKGDADGGVRDARFNGPFGLAVDVANNVYVADNSSHTIRKITAGGVVSTLAGLAGSPGSTDGIGRGARFDSPLGLAVDGAGNVYVADNGNRTIRMITPGGVVSTLKGLFGGCNGFGCGGPLAVAVDSSGKVYVTEWGSRTIRKISPVGEVSSVAGVPGRPGTSDTGSAYGTGSDARFSAPAGVALDSVGNLYLADHGNHTIRMGTPVPITEPAFTRNSWSRLSNGQFQFELTASTNQLVLIQATSVIPAEDWITLQAATLSTGRITITDPHASGFAVRFYRLVSPVP